MDFQFKVTDENVCDAANNENEYHMSIEFNSLTFKNSKIEECQLIFLNGDILSRVDVKKGIEPVPSMKEEAESAQSGSSNEPETLIKEEAESTQKGLKNEPGLLIKEEAESIHSGSSKDEAESAHSKPSNEEFKSSSNKFVIEKQLFIIHSTPNNFAERLMNVPLIFLFMKGDELIGNPIILEVNECFANSVRCNEFKEEVLRKAYDITDDSNCLGHVSISFVIIREYGNSNRFREFYTLSTAERLKLQQVKAGETVQ